MMLRCFTSEEQTTASTERDEIVAEVNTYNRRYSGDPIPVNIWLTYINIAFSEQHQGLVEQKNTISIIVWSYKRYHGFVSVAWLSSWYANTSATLSDWVFLIWRHGCCLSVARAALFCCRFVLLPVTSRHYTGSSIWHFWILGRPVSFGFISYLRVNYVQTICCAKRWQCLVQGITGLLVVMLKCTCTCIIYLFDYSSS